MTDTVDGRDRDQDIQADTVVTEVASLDRSLLKLGRNTMWRLLNSPDEATESQKFRDS